MEMEELAYEIKVTPILCYQTIDHTRKVEAIQTKTITFFRYVYATLYPDEDEIIDVKFFLDKEKAITYWNEAMSRQVIMTPYSTAIAVTA